MRTESLKKAAVRLFASVIALALLAGIVPRPARAEEGIIRIRTAQELLALSDNCVSDSYSSGLTVILENDIELSGIDFRPIPLFGGSFNGNGHKITGLRLDGKYGTAGLFRMLLETGSVDGLTVEGILSPSYETEIVGGIAAENRGVIRNCVFSGTVSGVGSVGGIVGYNRAEGLVESCTFTGSVSGQHRVGGIAGDSDGIIRFCTNYGRINTEVTEESRSPELGTDELLVRLNELRLSAEELIDITDIGGIAGKSAGVVRKCINNGEVGHSNIGYNIGGVVGHLSAYADGCENNGSVHGRKDVGGIVGQIDPYTEWNVSGDKINTLREKLNALQGSVSRLTSETGSQSGTLSADLTELFAALSEAGNALDTLSGGAVGFVNANVETLNLMSARIHETVGALAPVAADLSGFTEQLPAVFDRLSSALAALHEASVLLGSDYADSVNGLQSIRNELESIRREITALLELLQTYADDPENVDMGELLSAAAGCIRSIRDSFTRINASVGDLLNTLSGIGSAGEPLNDALSALHDTAALAAHAFESLDSAQALLWDALDRLSRYDALTFTPISDDTDARSAFFRALANANSALTRIAAGIGTQNLSSDVEEISENLFDLINFCIDSLEGVRTIGSGELIEDISARTNRLSNGTVNACINNGSVSAEANAGGVVGTISLDFEFDMEDQFSLSRLLSGGAKYVVFSAVFDSTNIGGVSARKNCAGGIIGRMDYGVVADCGSSGSITAGSDYAGGIAGSSAGTLTGCFARVLVSAGDYAGGIAGTAHNISNCLVLAGFTGDAGFRGTVAGNADGAVESNFYADSDIGGVNGFSYTGCSDRIEYSELLRKSGYSELLSMVRIEYCREGELYVAMLHPYGSAVDTLPSVPDRDGKHWRWDDFDQSVLRSDLRVDGRYLSPVFVLVSDEDGEKPLFLVEGSFDEAQKLEISEYSPDLASVGAERAKLLSASTLRVEGCSDPLTVHFRTDKNGVLYTTDGSGKLQKTEFTRDGSYIVFSLENGGSFAYVRPRTAYIPYIIGGVAAVTAIGLAVFGIVRKRRKAKTSNEKSQAEPAA